MIQCRYFRIRSEGCCVCECFEYGNEKFSWSGEKKLMNNEVVIAKLEAPFLSWTNIGELTISMDMTKGSREIVLATFIAVYGKM